MSPSGLLRRLNLKPSLTVLEVGPGPGYYSVAIARAIPGGKLILLDVQPEMLDMARERIESSGFTNVDYVQGDAASVPLESGSVDVALLVCVLGEVPEPAAVLGEIRRVLRPGGMLSLTEWMVGNPHSLRTVDLQKAGETAGFQMTARRGRLLSRTVDFHA